MIVEKLLMSDDPNLVALGVSLLEPEKDAFRETISPWEYVKDTSCKVCILVFSDHIQRFRYSEKWNGTGFKNVWFDLEAKDDGTNYTIIIK